MFPAADAIYLYQESALHVGSGEQGTEIDLPIQRETTTDFPLVPGSSLKGAWRAQSQARLDESRWIHLFGPPALTQPRQAAALGFSDGRLLLFPARSLKGVFVWTTSAEVWARHRRDLAAAGLDVSGLPTLATASDSAYIAPGAPLMTARQTIVLEELSFPAQARKDVADASAWLADHAFPAGPEYEFWRTKVRQALVVLPEDAFRHFAVMRTEVIPRVRIDPTIGSVAEGALWTEEFVPAETLFYAVVGALPRPNDDLRGPAPETALGWLKEAGLEYLQLGGDRTLGKGITRLQWLALAEKT